MKFIALFFLLFTPICLSTPKQTITYLGGPRGKSCQICIKTKSVKVCKFYKKCPIRKKNNKDI